mgnify:CR=1 FL=1
MNLVDFNVDYFKLALDTPQGFVVKYAAELELDDQFRSDQKFSVIKCHESFICLNPAQLQDVYLSISKGFVAVTMVVLNDFEHVALAMKPST